MSLGIHFQSRQFHFFSNFCVEILPPVLNYAKGFLFFFLLHGFLVLLLSPLDDKALTDVTGLCQNGCSDIENRKH